jgi:cytochrome o ubiquinol oxidase subunit 1
MKARGYERPTTGFIPIHMPANTGAGVVLAGISTVLGFALIWQMWIVACLMFVVLLVTIVVHTFNYKRDYHIHADEVIRTEDARTRLLEAHV